MPFAIRSDSLSPCPTVKAARPMISAIVFAPDRQLDEDVGHAREVVVRSLVWLVSAVVASVVRDVTLAAPVGLGLSELADQSGCLLVQADLEGERLSAAIAASKGPRVLVMQAGYQPDPGLVDEIDAFARRQPAETIAALLATPETLLQRLFPHRARVVGVLCPRAVALTGGDFARLAKLARRAGHVLRTAARPIG